MVKYLTDPKKSKIIDPAPLYFNCNPDTIALTAGEETPSRCANFKDCIGIVRHMAKNGRSLADVYAHLGMVIQQTDAWMLEHLVDLY